MNYQGRIDRLRQSFAEKELDAVLVRANATSEYFCGAKRLGEGCTPQRQNSLEYASLLITQSDVILMIPRLMSLGIFPFLPDGLPLTKTIGFPDEDLYGQTFVQLMKSLHLEGASIGVNRDITATQLLCMQEQLGCKVVDISATVDLMRAVKDADEISLMRKNAEIADEVYHEIMPFVHSGAMVRDLEIQIQRGFENRGCSGVSFPSEAIVLGPGSGPVFGMNYDRLEKGYTLAFDFGGVYGGYCSDFGRTIFIGEPTEEMARIHQLVMASQKAGMEAMKAGISTGEQVNLAARNVLVEAGYGDQFIHRLGHGIGKDVHERPFLAMGEHLVLQSGMTFTAEPSVVQVQKACIRVEDVVLVTDTGYESLNKITRDIVVVD